MDKNFHCLARLIYINSIIKLEYNTLFKLNSNFINFDFQITEEEEKLIKSKNSIIKNNLEYKRVEDKNFEGTYYGYFEYFPNEEREYEINGFGIKVSKNFKYMDMVYIILIMGHIDLLKIINIQKKKFLNYIQILDKLNFFFILKLLINIKNMGSVELK